MNTNVCPGKKECSTCLTEILQVICILQENACPDNCLNACDRPALGGGSNCVVCNTRPIMLYTCCGNGVPWAMPVDRNSSSCETSTVFRVEKIDGCCCTFRVLAPNVSDNCLFPYVATDSIFTMDISCMCALRCLNDTYVECL